jgi:ATP-dependent Clp protease ATP-binding subunit ClpC
VLERFTDTARRVVIHAQEEARALQHGHIGTEHLLLGLLRGDTDDAVRVLDAAGVTLDGARRDVEELVGRGTGPSDGDIPFTVRAKKVLEMSLREALQLGDEYIRSEHILLGLIRESEGTGARVLQRRGVDTFDLRRGVIAALHAEAATQGPPGPEERTADRPEWEQTEHPEAMIVERLTAIERRLERIERLLRDGPGPRSA